jgi:hypothetical protein
MSRLSARRYRRRRFGLFLERLEDRSLLSAIAGETAADAGLFDAGDAPGAFASQTVIQTRFERIPNFVQFPTVRAIANGNWSDTTVWSTGQAPQAEDVVLIEPGVSVVYDAFSDVAFKAVGIEGALRFLTDQSTRLKVGTLLVLPGGILEIGSESSPVESDVSAEVLFADTPLDTAADPSQYANGLIALGTVRMHGAAKSETFVRLAAEPQSGDTTLTLEHPVSGWKPGDQLLLPDTRQLKENERKSNYQPQWEILTLAGVDGTTLSLSTPLQFDHGGARDLDGNLDSLPHVGNLSRNVKLRSENPPGTRGHTMFLDRAEVDIRYVGFLGLGRTTNQPLDNTLYDSNGGVTHIGSNQSGRYPVHFNHLIGPTNPLSDGYQYRFVGNSIMCPLDPMPFKWGISIHDSHYGLISGNVLYNWAGAGLVTEVASESFNVIEKNFVVRVHGTGRRDDMGRDGAGFWLRGPNNWVRDNVAANITADDPYSYGFNLFFQSVGDTKVPAYQGADPALPEQSVEVDMNAAALREFARNEVYGATANGLTYWWIGINYTTPIENAQPSTISDFKVWNHYQWALFAYESSQLTIDRFTARADGGSQAPYGLIFSDYASHRLTVRNADVQGMLLGISPSHHVNGPFTIEDSFFRNRYNITVDTPWTSGSSASTNPPRATIISNVRFKAMPGAPLRTISVAYPQPHELGFRVLNLIEDDAVYVYDYNGEVGNNFQVFYYEQHPSFVVPQTNFNLTGSPEAGLTNLENWEQYGIAIAGAVAPCIDSACSNALDFPEIYGYVFPISTDANQPPVVDDQTFSVAEHSLDGTIVGTVTAGDPDPEQVLTFSIESGNTNGALAIHPSTGVIRVADRRYLDYETGNPLTLRVRVRDDAVPAGTDAATITVYVEDVNEPPVATNQTFTVSADAENGAVLGAVTANDPDAGQSLSFAITGGNESGAFAIDGQSGLITVAGAHLLASQGEFTLTVAAADNGVPPMSDVATITVVVNRGNQSPVVEDQAFTVAEESPHGKVVGTVAAHDPDIGQSLAYSITAGNDGDAFAIDAQTGQITVNNVSIVDFESRGRFALTVSVIDNAASPLADTAIVTIDVTDQNEFPIAEDQSFSVAANALNGMLVGVLAAVDPDAGQSLTFAITNDSSPGVFAIDSQTGEITVADRLRLLKTSSFSFNVTVTDDGSPRLSDNATVVVNVNPVAPNRPPVLVTQALEIPQNSPPGTVVGTLAASDPDSGQTLAFEIISGNRPSPFAIDSRSGVITLVDAPRFNREKTNRIVLRARVSDDGFPSLSASAAVTIRRTNAAVVLPLQKNNSEPGAAAVPSQAAPDNGGANPQERWDVNRDGHVGAGDLLPIVAVLREERAFRLPATLRSETLHSDLYPDVTGDDLVSIGDLLDVLARIRSLPAQQ